MIYMSTQSTITAQNEIVYGLSQENCLFYLLIKCNLFMFTIFFLMMTEK